MENQYLVTIPEEELQRLAEAVKTINPNGPEPILAKDYGTEHNQYTIQQYYDNVIRAANPGYMMWEQLPHYTQMHLTHLLNEYTRTHLPNTIGDFKVPENLEPVLTGQSYSIVVTKDSPTEKYWHKALLESTTKIRNLEIYVAGIMTMDKFKALTGTEDIKPFIGKIWSHIEGPGIFGPHDAIKAAWQMAEEWRKITGEEWEPIPLEIMSPTGLQNLVDVSAMYIDDEWNIDTTLISKTLAEEPVWETFMRLPNKQA